MVVTRDWLDPDIAEKFIT